MSRPRQLQPARGYPGGSVAKPIYTQNMRSLNWRIFGLAEHRTLTVLSVRWYVQPGRWAASLISEPSAVTEPIWPSDDVFLA